jgi:presenilin-like A22 family membrane protease
MEALIYQGKDSQNSFSHLFAIYLIACTQFYDIVPEGDTSGLLQLPGYCTDSQVRVLSVIPKSGTK